MHRVKSRVLATLLVLLVPFAAGAGASSPTGRLPGLLRLYVLDCGAIHVADTARYELRREEVETSELSVACFLIVHPKGALIWDVGAVPDSEWQPTGSTIVHHLSLPDGQTACTSNFANSLPLAQTADSVVP
jgi:hypothetical protein